MLPGDDITFPWAPFVGVFLLTFSPMHFLGFNVMPRRIPDFPDSFHSWNFLSSIGSGITFLSFAMLTFLSSKHLSVHCVLGRRDERKSGRDGVKKRKDVRRMDSRLFICYLSLFSLLHNIFPLEDIRRKNWEMRRKSWCNRFSRNNRVTTLASDVYQVTARKWFCVQLLLINYLIPRNAEVEEDSMGRRVHL